MDISLYNKIDTFLFHISKKLKMLGYLEALNVSQQKKRFLANEIENPTFTYKKLRYDPLKIIKDLKSINPPNDEIGKLQRDMIEELKIRNAILRNLGKKSVMLTLSSKLFGRADRNLVMEARSILKKENEGRNKSIEEKKHTWKDILEYFKSYFEKLQLDKWHVSSSRQHSVSVASTQRTIKISPFKKYSDVDKKRLVIHEIHGHVFRSENGYHQPLLMFAIGLPKFLSTEEGITTVLEEKAGVRTSRLKIRYALRVLAIDSIQKGKTFRECFTMIRKYLHDDNEAWEITYRVFRGGGFVKDHLYLKGYLQMLSFLEKGGSIQDLYLGKIGFHHIELTQSLLADNILKPPKFLPHVEL